MQSTDIPVKFPIPFAASAGVDFRRDIPKLSQIGVEDGAASLTDGFPPLNATPLGAGGVPPSIKDMNGALYRITGWARWIAAGGPVFYDVAFVSDIGGYPAGAVLASAVSPGTFFVSIVNNNTTNPDTGGAGWQPLAPVAASGAEVAAGALTTKFITPNALALQRASGSEALAASDATKLITAAALASLRASSVEALAGTDSAKYISPSVRAALRASAADVIAGTNDARHVTPASLADAFAPTASIIRFPGGRKMQFGRFTAYSGGEPTVTVTIPEAYATSDYRVQLTPVIHDEGNFNDTWVQLANDGVKTVNSFRVKYQRGGGGDPGLNGFEWMTYG